MTTGKYKISEIIHIISLLASTDWHCDYSTVFISGAKRGVLFGSCLLKTWEFVFEGGSLPIGGASAATVASARGAACVRGSWSCVRETWSQSRLCCCSLTFRCWVSLSQVLLSCFHSQGVTRLKLGLHSGLVVLPCNSSYSKLTS